MKILLLFGITISTFVSIYLLFQSGIVVLNEVYREYQKKYVTTASQTLKDMFIFLDPWQLFLFNIISTVIFAFIGIVISSNLMIILGFSIVGFFLPKLFIWRAQKKRVINFQEQIVDGLTVLSNSLKSGMNFVQAIETLVNELTPPISQEFSLVLNQYKLGIPIEKALLKMTYRIPSDDLKLFVTSVNIVSGLGGDLTKIFETISFIITERLKIEGKTKALTSQGKLQALIVGLLPSLLGVLLYFIDPVAMRLMFVETAGIMALFMIIIFQIIGYFMIKKVTTIEV